MLKVKVIPNGFLNIFITAHATSPAPPGGEKCVLQFVPEFTSYCTCGQLDQLLMQPAQRALLPGLGEVFQPIPPQNYANW
jgi:hypothetical protein